MSGPDLTSEDCAVIEAQFGQNEIDDTVAMTGERCAELLDDLRDLLRRFVVMSQEQAVVTALWVVHTHLIDAADATPYLAVTSAEKRSGKTRLLEVLDLVVRAPWLTGRATAAVLPRKIDAEAPTLLLDESDAAFNGDKEYAEALRGVLNSGHRRGGRTTVCVGQGASMSYKDFATFSAKAIAGIGNLPDTVADRAIPLRLERRARGEDVERFRRREVQPEAERLRQALEAFAASASVLVKSARPELPAQLDDRAWDGVEPLLAIAELAGEKWATSARMACVKLYEGRLVEDESTGVLLLSDVRQVFGDRDRITTADLLAALNALEESPWGDWYGKPFSSRRLAKLLKPYGIKSRTIQVEHGEKATAKGFLREQFDGAWNRYLAPSGAPNTSDRQKPHSSAENSGSESVRSDSHLTDKNRRNPAPQAGSDGLTDRGPDGGAGETLGAAWDRLERRREGLA
jgi:Protein of unknown function (DUF3631)